MYLTIAILVCVVLSPLWIPALLLCVVCFCAYLFVQNIRQNRVIALVENKVRCLCGIEKDTEDYDEDIRRVQAEIRDWHERYPHRTVDTTELARLSDLYDEEAGSRMLRTMYWCGKYHVHEALLNPEDETNWLEDD